MYGVFECVYLCFFFVQHTIQTTSQPHPPCTGHGTRGAEECPHRGTDMKGVEETGSTEKKFAPKQAVRPGRT